MRIFTNLINKCKKVFYRASNSINYEEAIEIYSKEKSQIIDVRTPEEYREKHLDHAINIPLYDIENKIIDIIPNKDTVIMLYCRTGHRSNIAKGLILNLGYENVYTINIKMI